MKKGFTLIELMGVIVILAIIGTVIAATINNNIDKSRSNLCKTQENVIIEAAKMYLTDNPNENYNEKRIEVINDLQAKGYIDEDVVNPINKEKYNASTYVLVEKDESGYSYTLEYVGDDALTCGYEKGSEIIKIKDLLVTLSPTTYTYDGNEKKPTVTVKDTKKNISLTNGKEYKVEYKNNINAGTATAIITGTVQEYVGEISKSFNISQATPTLTITPTSGTVVSGKTLTFTEKANVKGTFRNTSSSGSIAAISPATNSNVTANTNKTITVTGKSGGTSTITVNFTPTSNNYKTASKTYTANIISSATIPTSSLCVSRTFNGNTQQLTSVTSGTGYTLSNCNQKNPGTYTITATLKSGYRWSDNTTGNKTFSCTMKELPKPTCQVNISGAIYGNTDWYRDSVNVYLTTTGTVNTQGLATTKNSTNGKTSVTVNKTGSYTYYGYVANAAGSNTCSRTVKVDATAPTCGSVSNTSTKWRKTKQTITQYCNDSGSGCEKSSYATTYSNNKTGGVYIYDKSRHYTYCSYNVYVDTTRPYTPYVSKISTKIEVTSGNATAYVQKASTCSKNDSKTYNDNRCDSYYYFHCNSPASGQKECWVNTSIGTITYSEAAYASPTKWQYYREESGSGCSNSNKKWRYEWVDDITCDSTTTNYKKRAIDEAGNVSGVLNVYAHWTR